MGRFGIVGLVLVVGGCAEGFHARGVRERAVSDLPCAASEIHVRDIEGNDKRFVARGCGKKIEYEWRGEHLQSTTSTMTDPSH